MEDKHTEGLKEYLEYYKKKTKKKKPITIKEGLKIIGSPQRGRVRRRKKKM